MSTAVTPATQKVFRMNNNKKSLPKFKQNATLGAARQYNAVVNYMITKIFGVKAAYITDPEIFLKHFSELLWEIDRIG